MPTLIETSAPTELKQADLQPRGAVHPSPIDWRDQILYFLLPDRFADGREDARPLYDRTNPTTFRARDRRVWAEAGKLFQGGTLKGIQSKLGYLRDLGVTTLWIGPIWRQRKEAETYHGYGIQNFCDVDQRFGTRQDLRNLTDAAHEKGMYVLLDIVYNHTGDNWTYPPEDFSEDKKVPYRFDPPYTLHRWRSGSGDLIASPAAPADAVWPSEFQSAEYYTRAGQIDRWDPESWEDPMHPNNEFRRGDFLSFKDLALDRDPALQAVIRAYQYWIAISDCDGFRIDTVKHVPLEASRKFCGAIREYAEAIGKQNFLLLGEVTGGAAMARNYLEIFGKNIDAALDIGDPAKRLTAMTKGWLEPREFFDQFENHRALGTHRQTGRYHVSILDDHDMVAREKRRYAAGNNAPESDAQTAHAIGAQLTTLGIPCIYYGSEQAFDGMIPGDMVVSDHEDRFVRESMFGGTFGALGTEGCHFFDPNHPCYLRVAAIARVVNSTNAVGKTLRRGRQYLRDTSTTERSFEAPRAGEIAAWSRILYDREVLVALNTNGEVGQKAAVTVDSGLHPDRSTLTFLYRGEWSDAELRNPPPDQTVEVRYVDGRATALLDLPPAGMAILT